MFRLPPHLPRQLQQQHVLLETQVQQTPVVLNFPWALAGLQLGLMLQETLPQDRVKEYSFKDVSWAHSISLNLPSCFHFLNVQHAPEENSLLAFLLTCHIFFSSGLRERGLHPQLTQLADSQGWKKQWQQLLNAQASNPQVFVYPINYLHLFNNSQPASGPSLQTSGLPL